MPPRSPTGNSYSARISPDRSDDLELLAGEVQAGVAAELAHTLPPDRLLAPTPDDEAQVWAVITTQLASAERALVLANQPALAADQRKAVGQQVFDALLRLGPLQRYLADPEVEELMVNGHTTAFVVSSGGRKHEILTGFGSETELRAFAARTVAATGRRLDEASPAVDARLPDGSRLHVITPPLAACTCLTIRRHRLAARSLADLIELGTLTPGVAQLLAAAVRAGLNILVSGGTASGKTSMLNALGAEIPPDERVVTIEQTKELQLDQHLADCLSLEARFGNVEGIGEVTQRDLVRHALRMRPRRIVVGEVRGPEALDMLIAMNSGHDGSSSTLHANTARQALAKLRTLAMWAETGLPGGVVSEMIADTLDLVCQLHLQPDGRRVLVELVEVVGVEGDRILTNRLAVLDQDRRPALTGLRPQHADRLSAAGWRPAGGIPSEIGGRW